VTGTAKPKPELLLTEARADYSSGKWLEARTKSGAAQAVAALITDDLLALGRCGLVVGSTTKPSLRSKGPFSKRTAWDRIPG
jgi:hypothetical protein